MWTTPSTVRAFLCFPSPLPFFLPALATLAASATEHLAPFLRDEGEGRRLGMLVVWYDGGIASDTPLLAAGFLLAWFMRDVEDRTFYMPGSSSEAMRVVLIENDWTEVPPRVAAATLAAELELAVELETWSQVSVRAEWPAPGRWPAPRADRARAPASQSASSRSLGAATW